jgi:glycosyltransferase involved in cell wall biosynthesis
VSVTPVVIDATALSGEGGYSGIGTYVANLVGALARRDDVAVTALVADDTALPDGVEPRPVSRWWRERRRALLEHEVRMVVDLRRAPDGLLHSPSVDPPRWPGRPFVQTLFDTIPLTCDDADLVPVKRLWQRWAPRYRQAAAVLAISQHSADDGIRVLGLDPRRVHVVPLGVGPEFSPRPCDERSDVPSVLLVAEYSDRKGFADAFAAIADVADAGLPHRLLVAGRIRPATEARLRAAVAHAPNPDRIEVLGYVDDLPARYRSADAVIVPSRYEGFGLPALEAMACGVPVIAYDNTALPEVIGDAGVLVPDGDAAALGRALLAVLTDAPRRGDLIEAGLARAARFSWEQVAAETAAVYHEVAG